jgi:hypothetical protein
MTNQKDRPILGTNSSVGPTEFADDVEASSKPQFDLGEYDEISELGSRKRMAQTMHFRT